MAAIDLPSWKSELIDQCLGSGILTFGTFTLKSGRISPYFVNCGLFCEAKLIKSISRAYARTLDAYAKDHAGFQFDVLFGPAYKGIPFASNTADKLDDIDESKYGRVGYAFNRKEVKDHGEGGIIVGSPIKGKKVVIIDDVMTSGKAIREAISIIEQQGGTLVGIVVALDREEKMPSQSEKDGKGDDGCERGSAIGEVRRETGVPVLAILTLSDIVKGMKEKGREKEVADMQEYYAKYGSKD
jgi:orotate phosphoribosyltransferase